MTYVICFYFVVKHTPCKFISLKKYFCNEKCLGKYLVDKVDDETEAVWVDTPENIRMCALERQAEFRRDAEEFG